ncbi:MAG: hypothetical protein JWO64_1296 [Hyphomicrobiales bacterium]|jgi:hypothetical protein|nr:hypothetical protein [Hyphomicrobiales bacterium]
MRIAFLFLATMFCVASPALGQGAGLNLFGTVERMEAGRLVIKTDAGDLRDFLLDPKLLVLKNTSTTLAEIKANDFIASAAMPGPDGKLHSTEVRIYPDALRGIGEGQRAMTGAPGQTMTNATVEGAAIVKGSNVVRVTFPGGVSELVVDPGVPVTKIEQVEPTAIKPGSSVRVQGQQNPEGSVASRITLLK